MVDTFTSQLRILKMEPGTRLDIWGEPDLNPNAIRLMEESIAGRTDVDVTASNVVLTTVNGATDEARRMFLRITGTPGVARDITVPTLAKIYVIRNESDSVANIRTAANPGIVVQPGQNVMAFIDQDADLVRAVTIQGDVVIEAADWQSGTFDINGSVSTGTYRYSSQGAHAIVLIPPFSANVSLNSFSISPNTPSNWPEEIRPDGAKTFQCWVTDNGTQDEAFFNVNAGPSTSWSFGLHNGNFFTPTTVRSLDISLMLIYNTRDF